jgi:Pyruvate/2-oxoacid:ferredoxin oxidoreductase delta subunit
MKRQIITIDAEKCNGCGLCVDACAEGAIQLVDGKARLVRDDYCDGLGACLGECPQGAISMAEREAAPFDPGAVAAHLGHGQAPQATPPRPSPAALRPGGCPGMAMVDFGKGSPASSPRESSAGAAVPSALRQWPIQLHLVPTTAPYWQGADLLLAADCTAFALGGFHGELLQGRRLIIACPKLDDTAVYVEKLATILAENDIRSLTIARMEVPCCGGLVRIAQQAIAASGRDLPCKVVTVGLQGDLRREDAQH